MRGLLLLKLRKKVGFLVPFLQGRIMLLLEFVDPLLLRLPVRLKLRELFIKVADMAQFFVPFL